MGIGLFLISVVIFLLYQFFTKGSAGFKQWWNELGSLPLTIMHGSVVVAYSVNAVSRYRLNGFDHNTELWIILTLIWLVLTIYDFVKLYQKQQYRYMIIACIWIAVFSVSFLFS